MWATGLKLRWVYVYLSTVYCPWTLKVAIGYFFCYFFYSFVLVDPGKIAVGINALWLVCLFIYYSNLSLSFEAKLRQQTEGHALARSAARLWGVEPLAKRRKWRLQVTHVEVSANHFQAALWNLHGRPFISEPRRPYRTPVKNPTSIGSSQTSCLRGDLQRKRKALWISLLFNLCREPLKKTQLKCSNLLFRRATY